MRKSKRLILLGGLLLVAAGLYVHGGQASASVPRLTALDYVQIEQLYSHYGHYLDVADGKQFADLFTPDGVLITNGSQFGTLRGRKDLAALAVKIGAPPPTIKPTHNVGNVMIDPSPEGAIGSAYVAVPGAARSNVLDATFAKTAEGWRFKTVEVRSPTPAKN